MPTLTLNNALIHYQTHGDGHPILLSHAYGASAKMWQKQIPTLSQKYKLITWDMRGHGKSQTPNNSAAYSRNLTIQDMTAILNSCGAEKAVIGGLSMGGYMSLAFVMSQPHRASALMLLDSGPGFKKAEALQQWNDQAERQAQALEKKGLTAKPKAPPEVQHTDAQALAHAARGMLAQEDTSVIFALETIKLPTLVLAGENDKPFLAATNYMAKKIPNAEKIIIPNAGHYANYDEPKAFNNAVLTFLKKAGV